MKRSREPLQWGEDVCGAVRERACAFLAHHAGTPTTQTHKHTQTNRRTHTVAHACTRRQHAQQGRLGGMEVVHDQHGGNEAEHVADDGGVKDRLGETQPHVRQRSDRSSSSSSIGGSSAVAEPSLAFVGGGRLNDASQPMQQHRRKVVRRARQGA